MRYVRRYDLRKTKNLPRWGFIYTPRVKRHPHLPPNLDVFLGNHLLAFWGRDR